ncbi:LacI family DNA-binding transcriptional regulator [Microbacterium sp. GCS4]|uniref:LacI family DNA-binding transcriptional regulator n=1 Tax=Microbacterium sp. GCS4 TaxID=1692239 RepID=UPI00067FA1A0|nr:LacI family DNA-binding transcriptional regulator [Microbacterium sp. GCS4]KNY05855.1 hypothetical protein AKH00_08335 [Microbacterium sp. GCS4]
MVTMIDVARLAGVSQSTVSHVINKTRRIAPETEKRVLDAIEATGYVNDGVARSLRTGRTGTVGLAASALSNPYFADVVHMIEQTVSAEGLTLVLVDTHDEPEREVRSIRELLSRRPDGVIIAPSASPARAFSLLARRGVPAVALDRIPRTTLAPTFDSIGVENTESTAALVAHVVARGHRRIGFVAPRRGLSTTEERIAGYRLGLQRAGIDADSRLVVSSDPDPDRLEETVATLLGTRPRPTALIVGNNQLTIETMRVLRDLGVVVPDDLSIAAFDDFRWADLFAPRLTAIRQPVEMLGRGAAQLLLSRLRDPHLRSRSVTLPTTLQIRDSVAPAVR